MERSNETWVADLRANGSVQQAALLDLRRLLLQGLRGALGGRSRADEALLEDAAQEALVRILQGLTQFEGRARFTTWATSIAIRVAMTELRRRRFKDVSIDALASGTGFEFRVEAPCEDALERNALVATMYALVRDQLTERQRTALLAELGGLPQEEIARRLGSTRNAVYKLTHDARKRLKHALEEAGYGAEDIQSAFTR